MPTQRKYTFLLVITGVVCILALYLYRHRQGNTGKIDNFIIGMSGSIQKNFFYLGHGTKTIFENYMLLVNAKKQNEELQKEMESLRARLSTLQDVELENHRLRESLQFREKIRNPLVPAHVVAHDVSPDYLGIRIDKGANEGIKHGMGVVSPGGLVGRVRTVTAHYSDVATLIDPTSSIDVLIQRSRARGVLSGQSKTLMCKMKYVDRLEDVAANDTIVSTDFGNIFPKGLLVGYVHTVTPSSGGVLQSVVVRPAVDVYRLEEVFIVIPEPQSKTLSE